MTRALGWLGVVLCVALLLPNHYSPWRSSHQEFLAVAAFGPLLAGAVWSGHLPRLALGGLMLACIPLIQWMAGMLHFAGDAWVSAFYLAAFSLAVIAGHQVVAPHGAAGPAGLDRLVPLWGGLVLAGLLSVAAAAHQWLDLQRLGAFVADMPPRGRPYGNLAQPNQLSTLLLLGCMGLWFLWESARLHTAAALAAASLLVVGLVLTGSRSVLLMLAWFLPAFWFMRRRCQIRLTPAALAALLVVFVAFSASWSWLNDRLLLASPYAALDRLGQPSLRQTYWTAMLDAVNRQPWLGYGFNQAGVAQTAVALDHPPMLEFYESAHNVFLDLAVAAGVPVALLVLLGLGLWTRYQLRVCSTPQGAVTLAAVGVVFSHAMVEYPLHYLYFLLPVGLWMGTLTAVHATKNPELETLESRFAKPTLLAGAGFVLVAGLLMLRDYLPYEEHWRMLRYREAQIGDLRREPAPDTLLLTQLNALVSAAAAEPENVNSDELELLRRVAERYPYPSTMYSYAIALATKGFSEQAALVLQRLCQMQSRKSCHDAQKEWARAQQRQPQLASVRLPGMVQVRQDGPDDQSPGPRSPLR
ncbi:candidate membrane protein [Ramlibacter tataouinensis TTB310]|uniref:Candidate membrane protein n=1 Tax=Ramlibacter tataouinensis (strain ATCC BAA-407 / DSM 14655 / LMG 21543 / TTB310) TaxID=365046 RepID=F5Y280_RAMTT|nr:candidate membrane protein [Ramlibacter tataouinensis TTB310]